MYIFLFVRKDKNNLRIYKFLHTLFFLFFCRPNSEVTPYIYNTRACAREEKGAYPLSLRPLALSAKAESLASKARLTALPSQGGENCGRL